MTKAKSQPAKFPFRINETVVEPTIGICTVAGMRRMTVDGTEEDYYVFQAGNAKVMVPQSQLSKRGIRRPMSKDEVKKVLSVLKVPVTLDRNDARMQYTYYREIMKSGDPIKIAKLLRDLFTLDQFDELKGKEKEIMEQAKKFLCDEITHIRQAPKTQVMETINEALRQMYKKRIQKDKDKGRRITPGFPEYGDLGEDEEEEEGEEELGGVEDEDEEEEVEEEEGELEDEEEAEDEK